MGAKRVGIMTGGGDCPGLNAVIRAAVRVGCERHGFEMLGIEDATNGLIDLDYRSPSGNQWLTPASVRGILARGGTILGTSNKSDPFHFVATVEGKKVETDVSDRVMENYRKLDLDGVISIGGDGSMRIAKQFMDKGMNVVGVPKTIDNDLSATDQTFGFDTAVQIACEALDRLRDTAESHDRVMLVEVMGRDAGWIALHAGMAGGADAILIPEIPYTLSAVADVIKKRRAAGQFYSLIVVAEGAKPRGGQVCALEKKLGEMPRLMGAAHRAAEGLSEALPDIEMRVTVLGHIQRGGSPSSYDRVLATRYGVAAANLVASGQYGMMTALKGGSIQSVPIADAVAEPKVVDPEGELVRAAREIGVSFG